MSKQGGIIVVALGLALAVWAGSTMAAEHAHGTPQTSMEGSSTVGHSSGAGRETDEKSGHSHERCELHGGQVTMTKAHHFETVFAPEGISVYLYSEKQDPALPEGVKATAEVKRKDGTTTTILLAVAPLKKGEPAVWFCTMDPEVVSNAPGDCSKCGMKLVPQDRLFGKMDLSGVESGSMKVTFHFKGLPGKEKEVTFTETFSGLSKPGSMEHGEDKEHMEGHEGMTHPEGKGSSGGDMHGMH